MRCLAPVMAGHGGAPRDLVGVPWTGVGREGAPGPRAARGGAAYVRRRLLDGRARRLRPRARPAGAGGRPRAARARARAAAPGEARGAARRLGRCSRMHHPEGRRLGRARPEMRRRNPTAGRRAARGGGGARARSARTWIRQLPGDRGAGARDRGRPRSHRDARRGAAPGAADWERAGRAGGAPAELSPGGHRRRAGAMRRTRRCASSRRCRCPAGGPLRRRRAPGPLAARRPPPRGAPRSRPPRRRPRSRGRPGRSPASAGGEPWRRTCWRSTRAPPARTSHPRPAAGGARPRRTASSPSIFPKPGWVEHDLEEIWGSTVARCIARRSARRGSRARTSPPSASPTSARRPALWDREHRQAAPPRHRLAGPAHHRRVRASSRPRAHEPRVREKTGLVLDPYFSAHQAALAARQRAGRADARRGGRASCFGTIDTCLVWRLTGGAAHVTDVSNASRTLLMDLRTLRVGPRAARRCSACRPACCREIRALVGGVRHDAGREGPAGRHPDRGHRRGPAGGALRPGVLRARARPSAPTARARSC